MSIKLDTRAFFFKAKTDYLPYYKPFRITIDEDATLKDLLFAIQEQNENFSFPKQKLVFRINGWVVEAKQPLKAVVERLGTDLQIDPVTAYRSLNGLKINDADFMQSYSLLEPYADESDLKYYKTLYALHYASETSNYRKEYIGDAILLLAHKMISEGNPYKAEILKAITEVESGLFDCEYDNNLFDAQDHTSAIEALKSMAKQKHEIDAPSLLDMIRARFTSTPKAPAHKSTEKPSFDNITIPDIEEKFVAYYYGDNAENKDAIEDLITQKCAGLIRFDKAHKRCGLLIVEDDPALAFQKAGAILLDAFDNMAEVLVIEDPEAYAMISRNFDKIEKAVGREIGLELTTAAALSRQLSAVTA